MTYREYLFPRGWSLVVSFGAYAGFGASRFPELRQVRLLFGWVSVILCGYDADATIANMAGMITRRWDREDGAE